MSYNYFQVGPLLVPSKSILGYSDYGFAIVTYEPLEEQFALYRFFFAALIIIYSLISQYYLYKWSKQIKLKNNPSNKYSLYLIYFYWFSLIGCSLHFPDNLMRPVDYYTPWFVHCGILMTQDLTSYFWIYNNTIGMYSLYQMINYKPQKCGNFKFTVHTWLMYYHASNIWTGQAHFIAAPFFGFGLFERFSVLFEGIAAIILHLYMIKLSYQREEFFKLQQERSKSSKMVERQSLLKQFENDEKVGKNAHRAPSNSTSPFRRKK